MTGKKTVTLNGGPYDGRTFEIEQDKPMFEIAIQRTATGKFDTALPYKTGTYKEAYKGATIFLFMGYED